MRVFLSVIVPAYNEEARLGQTLRQMLNYLQAHCSAYEVVVVDDGSADDTSGMARRFAADDERVRVIRTEMNWGKGHAVKQGMLTAAGELLLFSDADLSTPIEELDNFLSAFDEGYDIVIGSRKLSGAQVQVHQKPLREWLGKGFTWLTNLLITGNISDVTCGFKAFRRPAARQIFSLQRIDDWSFDAEILFLAQKFKYRIKEVPVRWRNDPRTKVNLLRDIVRSFVGLVRIRWNDWQGKYKRDA